MRSRRVIAGRSGSNTIGRKKGENRREKGRWGDGQMYFLGTSELTSCRSLISYNEIWRLREKSIRATKTTNYLYIVAITISPY